MGKNLSFYWSEKCYACYEKFLLCKFSAVAEPRIKKNLYKGRVGEKEGKKNPQNVLGRKSKKKKLRKFRHMSNHR